MLPHIVVECEKATRPKPIIIRCHRPFTATSAVQHTVILGDLPSALPAIGPL